MDRIARFLYEIGSLERCPRSGWALLGQEGQTVAAHTHRVVWIAYLLSSAFPEIDASRVIRMALVHDLAEARTTDLNHLAQRYTTTDAARALADQTRDLPIEGEIRDLFSEYEAGETAESRLVKDADQIELLLAVRERLASGNRRGEEWIASILERLTTKPGRELAERILTEPTEWWRPGVGDDGDV